MSLRVQLDHPQEPDVAPPLPTITATKHGVHCRQFDGSNTNVVPFHCNGILQPLPPQHGHSSMAAHYDDEMTSRHSSCIIRQRNTFTIAISRPIGCFNFYIFRSYNAPLPTIGNGGVFDNSRWCYEGVVLSGEKMNLGRCWSPVQDLREMVHTGTFHLLVS